MTSRDEQMLSRIGFAERWLARARGQWTAGNQARSLLTLVLADAELRHAMDTAGAHRRTARHPPVTGVLLASLVASALLLIGRSSITPRAVATTPPPPVIRPSSLSAAPMGVVVLPARSLTRAVSVQTLVPGTTARTASSQMAAPPPVSSQVYSVSASGPAASLRLPSRSRPSLLDLVLTAERVLRQDPAGSSLP